MLTCHMFRKGDVFVQIERYSEDGTYYSKIVSKCFCGSLEFSSFTRDDFGNMEFRDSSSKIIEKVKDTDGSLIAVLHEIMMRIALSERPKIGESPRPSKRLRLSSSEDSEQSEEY